MNIYSVLGLVAGWFALVYLLNRFAKHFPFTKAIHWAYALTFEWFALLGIYGTLLMREWGPKHMHGRPILLVHGYLHHPKVWWFQKKWLEALGFGPIYSISLGSPFQSIKAYAKKVKEKAEMIAKETQKKELILIGHSMGGLVSSWYATQLAPPGTVTDVITIGSPLHGTPVARIGIGLNAREMEPKSPFLDELRSAMRGRSDICFRHIATETDLLVIPGHSALLNENQHHTFPNLGHTCLLLSKKVAAKIGGWLTPS